MSFWNQIFCTTLTQKNIELWNQTVCGGESGCRTFVTTAAGVPGDVRCDVCTLQQTSLCLVSHLFMKSLMPLRMHEHNRVLSLIWTEKLILKLKYQCVWKN